MKIGYARVSTVEQDLERQIARLQELGVDADRIYVDHGFTGKKMTRDGLDRALAAVRAGDELVVPGMDRLARNTAGALEVLQYLVDNEISFNMGGLVYDAKNPMSKMFFTILAAVAEAEGGWISNRTKEAMQHPKVRANLMARPARHDVVRDARILRDYEERDDQNHAVHTMADLMRIYKTSRASIYRAIERATVARAVARAREAGAREGNDSKADPSGGSLR